MSEILLKVEGMSCGHCQAAVEKALKAVAGVTDAKVDLGSKEVVVTGTAPREELTKAIEEAGYEVVG